MASYYLDGRLVIDEDTTVYYRREWNSERQCWTILPPQKTGLEVWSGDGSNRRITEHG